MNLNISKNYRKSVLLLILSVSVLRLIFTFNIELANDESYYWLYSQHLKSNYFDHPPLVALWIRIFTLNFLLPQSPGFLRLGSVVGCAISTWFIFKCVTLLSSERAGWFAACLYNASFYAGITAGFLIMPDTPQMVFWTLSLWLIAKLTIDDTKLSTWVLFGISAGLCIMSKVHGIFIWTGIGLYTLFYKRSWLAKSYLYVSVFISILICIPILAWNIKYNFATYSFNSKRVDVYGFGLNWRSFFYQAMQQIGINNLFNFILIILAIFSWRKYNFKTIPALRIYNLIGLPFALLLLYISLYRDDILPHWSGPAYVALIPIAAIRLDKINKITALPKLVAASVVSYILYVVICGLFILYYPGTYGAKIKPRTGTNDLTIDLYGWKEGGQQFDSIYSNEVQNGIIPGGTPVVCSKWWGAHIEYYFCKPLNIQMIGLGSMMDLHEYMWMNLLRKQKVNLNQAYCIVSSDEYYNPKIAYKNFYNQIDYVKNILILRSGKPAHYFYLYHLTGWKGKLLVMQ